MVVVAVGLFSPSVNIVAMGVKTVLSVLEVLWKVYGGGEAPEQSPIYIIDGRIPEFMFWYNGTRWQPNAGGGQRPGAGQGGHCDGSGLGQTGFGHVGHAGHAGHTGGTTSLFKMYISS